MTNRGGNGTKKTTNTKTKAGQQPINPPDPSSRPEGMSILMHARDNLDQQVRAREKAAKGRGGKREGKTTRSARPSPRRST